MGWCSGTQVFDEMLDGLSANGDIPSDKLETIKTLIKSLWNNDWDCEGDSKWFDYPLVQQAFKELEPDMFEDE